MSKATIHRLEKLNHFPHKVRLSSRSVGWLTEGIETWI
ncbi:MAG: AlpA family phage regulatory protein [Oligoflexus sp.]